MSTELIPPFNVTLDLILKNSYVLEFKQCDTGVNRLNITLTSNNVPVDLTDMGLTIIFTKEDGHIVVATPQIASAAEGQITYTLGLAEVAYVGKGIITVELRGLCGETVSSKRLEYRVAATTADGSYIRGMSDYPALTQLINAARSESGRVEAESGRAAAENGRTYNENGRVAAEVEREDAESDRITAESTRIFAENNRASSESSRITSESGRATAESGRVNNESTRISTESARVTAESGRVTAESNRVTAEGNRASAESARATAESERISAENGRVIAENNRVTAESGRATAESNRASAESMRIEAENVRVSNENNRETEESSRRIAETTREDNEDDRIATESIRITNESGRVVAENNRGTAEGSRITAESNRVTAESGRVSAENTRVSQENTRQSSETTRQTNENARSFWQPYSAIVNYVPGNKVYYDGSSYINKVACVGVVPTDTSKWQIIAEKGESIAANITVSDAGGYYAGANVEDVLQEIGAEIHRPSYSLPTLRTAPFTIPADAIDAGFGQMEVRGRSWRQELLYNRETWAEWSKGVGITGDAGGLKYTTNGSAQSAHIYTPPVKGNTKYLLLLNCSKNQLVIAGLRGLSYYTGSYIVNIVPMGSTGNFKVVFTTQSIISSNALDLSIGSGLPSGLELILNSVRLFECPAGSTISTDADTLTADQLAVKYPYVPGDRVYHALEGGARLANTNVNIWGGEKAADDIVQTVNNPAYAYKVTLDGRNCLVAIGHTAIQNKTFFDKFEPVTQYTIQAYMKNNGTSGGLFIISYADGTFSTLAGSGVTTSWQLKTLTTTAGKTVKNITLSGQYGGAITYYDYNTLQIQKGTVATAYVPYDASHVYIPPSSGLKSLPNGVCDVSDLVTGRRTRNVSDLYELQSGEFTSVSTLTNVVTVPTATPVRPDIWTTAGTPSIGSVRVLGKEEVLLADRDNASNVGRFYRTNTGRIDFIFALGTTLEQARTALAGTKVEYQLATPIIHDNACSGSLTAHPNGMVYWDIGCNLFNGNTLGGVMYIPADRPAINYVESVALINLVDGTRTPVAFTQPAVGAREIVVGTDGYYEVVYHGQTYSTNPDIYESHAVNRASQGDQNAKGIELLNEQMAQVENLTRKTASEILEERDSLWQEFTGPVASVPVDAGGIPEVEVLANTVNQMANNGVNYANWTVAGAGTTKGASIHLVQNGGTDLASLPIPGIKGNTQYTLVYRVLNSNNNSSFVLANNAPSFLDTTFVLPKTPGVQKVLITTKANVSADNAIKFVLDSANTEGTYIDITDIMLFEGDQTKNLGIDQYIQYGLQSSSDIRLTVPGKNLFDKSRIYSGYINDTTGIFTFDSTIKASDFIRVVPGKSYFIQVGATTARWGAWYDSNKVFISGFSGYDTPKIAPGNAAYIRFSISNTSYLDTTQLSLGVIAVPYESHNPTSAIIPGEFAAVGSVRDAIRYTLEKGWDLDDRCKAKVLAASDIISMYTVQTNLDYSIIQVPVGFIPANTVLTVSLQGYDVGNSASMNDITNIGKIVSYNSATGQIGVGVVKGTSLTDARNSLVGKTLIYQLAGTNSVSLTGIPALDLEPGGMLLVETGVVEFRARPGLGVLTIPDATKPIIAVDRVLKPVIQDGILHYEPITPASNTATTITLPAGYSDATEYKVVYKTNPTPLPTVRYRYGVNLAAKAAATEGLAVQTSKELSDFERYAIAQIIDMQDRLLTLEGT